MNNKYADKDCEWCGGTGMVGQSFPDNEGSIDEICFCVKTNKAENEGEMRSDMEREEKQID